MMLLRFTLLLLGMFWRAVKPRRVLLLLGLFCLADGTGKVLDCDKCDLGVLTACKPARMTCPGATDQCFIGIGVKKEPSGPVSYMEKGCLPVAECNKVVDGAAALGGAPEMKICCGSTTDCSDMTLDTLWNMRCSTGQ